MNLKINVLPYLAALVILLVPSCLKDQVSYFDQSAAERLQAVQKKTRETLAKPRYGWRMEYFIGNVDFDFGGKNLTLEFGAEIDTVRVRTEEYKDSSFTSYYRFTNDDGPVLSFDSFSPILHKYAIPSSEYYESRGGDFEFLIISCKDEEVILKGKRSGKMCKMYPLEEPADQYINWIAALPEEEMLINLFMNYETFGELQPRESGIFEFMKALPRFAAQQGIEFMTPSEVVSKLKPVGELSVMHPISWADEARDTSAWMGNILQEEAVNKLYCLSERIRLIEDKRIRQDWNYLQASDHFYYMSTKHSSDGSVHSHYSPYDSPYSAFTNYMNVLSDFLIRVREQFPEEIENEELNALLLTIRNQEKEIEELNREVEMLRNNIGKDTTGDFVPRVEVPAVEEEPEPQPEPKPEKAPAKKTAAKKATAKKKTAKKTTTKKSVTKK